MCFEVGLREHGLIAALVRPDYYLFAVAREMTDLNAISNLLDTRLSLVSHRDWPMPSRTEAAP